MEEKEATSHIQYNSKQQAEKRFGKIGTMIGNGTSSLTVSSSCCYCCCSKACFLF